MTHRIAVVGSINTDYVMRVPRFPGPGETLAGESFAIYGGGKGANQALAARRMGAQVRMIGAVGRDSESRQRLRDLVADGVDTSGIAELGEFGGIALIQVERASGQNEIVLFAGANAQVEPAMLEPALDGWCGSDCLVCCQLEIPMATVDAAFRIAKAGGASTLLNAAPFDSAAAELLGMVDHLIVNEIEAGQLLGMGPRTLDNVAEAADMLRRRGPKVVVITLGGYGAWIASDGFTGHVAAPSVEVMDSTGAGDAFVGAYAASVVSGETPHAGTRIAVAAGSLAVQRQGAQPSLPSRSDVFEALSRTSQ